MKNPRIPNPQTPIPRCDFFKEPHPSTLNHHLDKLQIEIETHHRCDFFKERDRSTVDRTLVFTNLPYCEDAFHQVKKKKHPNLQA